MYKVALRGLNYIVPSGIQIILGFDENNKKNKSNKGPIKLLKTESGMMRRNDTSQR